MGSGTTKSFDSVQKEIDSSTALGFYDLRKKTVMSADSREC